MTEFKGEVYLHIACGNLLVIGVIGNTLIIVYFLIINLKKLERMSPYHFLITYLAVVDVFVSIGVPISYFNKEYWSSNEFLCKYSNTFLGMTLPTSSNWILVVISYERYRKMVSPFKAPIRKKILFVVLVALLVTCTGCYIPLMKIHLFTNNECLSYANILNSKTTITAYFVGSLFYDCLIPSILMVWFYFKISVNVKQFHDTNKTSDQNHELQNHTRKKVALKTLRTLIIMYILFVFPGRFFSASVILIMVKAPLFYSQHYIALVKAYNLMEISVYLNNMGNIFIYAWLIVGFRRFLKRVFTVGLLERQSNTVQKSRHSSETRETYVL